MRASRIKQRHAVLLFFSVEGALLCEPKFDARTDLTTSIPTDAFDPTRNDDGTQKVYEAPSGASQLHHVLGSYNFPFLDIDATGELRLGEPKAYSAEEYTLIRRKSDCHTVELKLPFADGLTVREARIFFRRTADQDGNLGWKLDETSRPRIPTKAAIVNARPSQGGYNAEWFHHCNWYAKSDAATTTIGGIGP